VTSAPFEAKVREEHAAIRAARRRQRFARRRGWLLTWTAVWYLVLLLAFLILIPT
jgi:hypothetical protein